jgi:PAS domain S-box-containing protein
VIPYDSASVQRLQGECLEIVACQGFEGPDKVVGLVFPLDPKFPNYGVVTTKVPFAIEDVSQDYPHFKNEADSYESGRIRSWLGVPLMAKDQVIGMIALDRVEVRPYTAEESELAMAFANQAAMAIENARLYQAAQRELAERKQVEEALQRSKTEWESTFDAMSDWVGLIDLQTYRILRTNRVGEEFVGVPLAEIVGQVCCKLVHASERPVPGCPTQKMLHTHRRETAELQMPDSDRWLMITVDPMMDEDGNLVGAVHIAHDITERKQLETQLRQMQKMEAIGQLAAGICHDFNNLLTPIGGFADLLLWEASEGSQQQEYLHRIKIAARRAAALTGQLRLFTRQEKGERRSVQLNSVVEETRALLERSIPKEITIELHLTSGLWAVEADPSQISQVLVNLCVNARDAMPDGGTLTLETRNVTLDEEWARAILEAQPGRYVRLSVTDTGSGMSPEVQARLFEPFFTTKEVGKGTGMGLSVVYGIVKGHGGFINVYSEVGRGSTFHVYLPAMEWAMEEREVEGLELPTGTETILVVDDEEMVRALGQAVLERCGYTVLMAENGVQALEVYQAHRGEIPLVVLDVIMPQMGGRECLRRLRELDPQVKVLISTGYTFKDLAQELVTEGALGVVEKPFRIRDFAAAVRTALDKL